MNNRFGRMVILTEKAVVTSYNIHFIHLVVVDGTVCRTYGTSWRAL